jgi:hypothetical protein
LKDSISKESHMRKTTLLVSILSLFLIQSCTGSEETPLPDLSTFKAQPFKAFPFTLAAATLQAMSKPRAIQTLYRLAQDRSQAEKIFVLCRMLFTARPGSDFRRPGMGMPIFLGGTSFKDWPLEPIELVNGVPFLISFGYVIAGQVEPPSLYIEYCVNSCDWNSYRYKLTTETEEQEALKTLLADPRWRPGPSGDIKRALSAQTSPEGVR